jgi:chaperone required for assembly of F1-ATPase
MIRRFYKEVTLGEVRGVEVRGGELREREIPGGWQVLLDGRGIKTVGGAAQVAPARTIGEALAAEWRRQGEKIDPASLPLRDIADYAIDVVAGDPTKVIDTLVSYAETDTLCYRAHPDEPLHAHQQAVWEPLLTRFEADHGIALVRVSGILHRPQPPEALAALRARLLTFDPFTLAGVETMTTLAASLVIALAALDAQGEEEPLALWRAVCLEEEWQADLWGRDEEAEERRARREADFLRACGFARLTRQ